MNVEFRFMKQNFIIINKYLLIIQQHNYKILYQIELIKLSVKLYKNRIVKNNE